MPNKFIQRVKSPYGFDHDLVDAVDLKEIAQRHETGLGLAERLVMRHGDDLRYCHTWGKFLVWDSKRFRIDETAEVYRRAKDTVIAIYAEIMLLDKVDDRKARSFFAMKSEERTRLDSMVKLVQSEPGISVMTKDLDRDPMLLTVNNGTLNLKTGELLPHNRDDLITKLVDVDYDKNAQAPLWLAFLDQIMAGNKDLIMFLKRAVGYSLTGNISERVVFFLYGIGANGKTTFLETIRAVVGEYGLRTPTETLLVKRDGTIPNDVARLSGSRLVVAAEAEEGKRLAEALVKDITGGDTISARFLHEEFFEFQPQCKIWLSSNHKPVVRGTDQAIWDRIKLIPFMVTIPEERQDKGLVEKLKTELPGILAWAMEGCLEWQAGGLGVPKEVRAATAEYRYEMDVLGGFLESCCKLDPSGLEMVKGLYDAYVTWCTLNDEKPITKRRFGNCLKERGFDPYRTRVERGYRGIRLLPSSPAPNSDCEVVW